MHTRVIFALLTGTVALRKGSKGQEYQVVHDHQDQVHYYNGAPMAPQEVRGFPGAILDLRRKDSIVNGMVIDHCQDVVVARYPNFDLSKTIFGNIDSWVKQQYLSATLNIQPHWSDKAVFRVTEQFFKLVPAPPDVNRDIITWMNTECELGLEHADGSFLDHLKWGYEYSVANYPQQSPKVLLLHSIMGVGTNFFPIRKDQVPKLRTFITDDEYTQIESFPSMLRLLYADKLLPDLEQHKEYLSELVRIEMFRVMDNEPVTLTAEEFWVAMNMQLVHLVDFVPIANWNESFTYNDNFLVLFTKVYNVLKDTGLMQAKVGMVAPVLGGDVGPHPSLSVGQLMNMIAPDWAKWTLFTKSVADLSGEIGHSLDYKLVWKSAETCPRMTGEECWFVCDTHTNGGAAECKNNKCECPVGTCASNRGCFPA